MIIKKAVYFTLIHFLAWREFVFWGCDDNRASRLWDASEWKFLGAKKID